MRDVFLSYASADRSRVAALVHALEAQGLEVWWDRDIAYGENFHQVIEQALTTAGCVIVAWTRESIASEWVLNEASDARKRARLLPVLLEPVAPPLEFRHLQNADLSSWHGDTSDDQFIGLKKAVLAMLGRKYAPPPVARAAAPPRHWLQTWAGLALGAGALLLGVCALLITLKQVGWLGSSAPVSDRSGRNPNHSQTISPSTAKGAQPANPQGAEQPSATVAAPAEPLNLLDTEAGARLIAASEEFWKPLFSGKPTSTVVNRNGFAVLAVRGDKPVKFDTLAVFVDYTSNGNIKDLAIYSSSDSPEGPFTKVATVTIPNYRNMEKPFHELHFTPVQARFVKLEALSVRNDYGPNGYLGSIQLYSSGR